MAHPRPNIPEETAARIRRAINAHGVARVAQVAGLGTNTVMRAGAGLALQPASLKTLLSALDELERVPATVTA